MLLPFLSKAQKSRLGQRLACFWRVHREQLEQLRVWGILYFFCLPLTDPPILYAFGAWGTGRVKSQCKPLSLLIPVVHCLVGELYLVKLNIWWAAFVNDFLEISCVIPIWVICEQGAVLQSCPSFWLFMMLYLPVVVVIQAGGKFIPGLIDFGQETNQITNSSTSYVLWSSRIPPGDLWPHPALILTSTSLARLDLKGSAGSEVWTTVMLSSPHLSRNAILVLLFQPRQFQVLVQHSAAAISVFGLHPWWNEFFELLPAGGVGCQGQDFEINVQLTAWGGYNLDRIQYYSFF